MMKIHQRLTYFLLIGFALLLAGCEVIPNNLYRDVDGVKHIEFNDGPNRWDIFTLTFHAQDNQVSVPERVRVDVPKDIDAASGTITEPEFETLITLARAAPFISPEKQAEAESRRISTGRAAVLWTLIGRYGM